MVNIYRNCVIVFIKGETHLPVISGHLHTRYVLLETCTHTDMQNCHLFCFLQSETWRQYFVKVKQSPD